MARLSPKIVVIGAGSADFGADCLAGIFRTERLFSGQLCLVDIDETRLRLAERLAQRLKTETGSEIDLHATVHRAEALADAEFVVLAVAVDREDTWARDHEVALAHGIAHYAENGGPGAFAHTCRNLSLVIPIARDIERLCPAAHVLSVTNPLTRICTALSTATTLRPIGVCHGIGIGYWIVATALHEELGVSLPADPRFVWRDDMISRFEEAQRIGKERYAIRAAGINHFTWILGVEDRITGEDVTDLVRRRLTELPPTFEPLTRRLADVFGLVPIQSDTHVSEYVPYSSRPETWGRYDVQLYDFAWARQRRAEHMATIQRAVEGGPLDAILGADSERIEFVIDAIANDTGSYEEALNIPNRGAIENLPADAIVEVPCTVGAEGPKGIPVGPLPEPIAAMCRTQLTIADLNVQAYLSGDRDLVHQLMAIDPMVTDLDTAVQLADEYMELYSDYVSFA